MLRDVCVNRCPVFLFLGVCRQEHPSRCKYFAKKSLTLQHPNRRERAARMPTGRDVTWDT